MDDLPDGIKKSLKKFKDSHKVTHFAAILALIDLIKQKWKRKTHNLN